MTEMPAPPSCTGLTLHTTHGLQWSRFAEYEYLILLVFYTLMGDGFAFLSKYAPESGRIIPKLQMRLARGYLAFVRHISCRATSNLEEPSRLSVDPALNEALGGGIILLAGHFTSSLIQVSIRLNEDLPGLLVRENDIPDLRAPIFETDA